MAVDVCTETVIARPRDVVVGYAADPDNTPTWYANIESIEWQTDPVVEVGSAMAFVAHFLGRRLAYAYEIVEYEPDERMVMRTQQGPFPMEPTYEWKDAEGGGTHMTLRNRGTPSGFAKLSGAVMQPAMRRANRKDLAELRRILESEPTD